MSPPIVTLTMNPTIDVASETEGVRPNHKTRTIAERIDPGGGGVNVASTIGCLDGEAVAVVAAGGITGRYLLELLDERHLTYKHVPIVGRTRLCTNVHDRASGLEYRFIPEGPKLSDAEWQSVLDLLGGMEWRWLVASGSLPRGVPADFYARVARLAAARGADFVLDSSGAALRAALGTGVTLIKPSLSELEYLAGHALPTRAAQAKAARHIVETGAARMLALTLGGEGALLARSDGVVFMPALDVDVRSTVGAGDGFLAAMVLALSRGAAPEEALAWGMAAGAAVASSDGTASVQAAVVRTLFEQTQGRAVPLTTAGAGIM